MTKKFTGRHMAAILIAFFGVIIAVNLTMATFATRTFGGTVVANSYVASQKYNGWLAAARAQEALGWASQVTLGDDRRVRIAVTKGDQPLAVEVEGFARHPLGREGEVPLRFMVEGEGLVADAPLPAGRWLVHLLIRHGGDEARLIETLS